MFQVSPMMTGNPRRNTIIGNTVLTIIFQQDGSFDPADFISQVLRTCWAFAGAAWSAYTRGKRTHLAIVPNAQMCTSWCNRFAKPMARRCIESPASLARACLAFDRRCRCRRSSISTVASRTFCSTRVRQRKTPIRVVDSHSRSCCAILAVINGYRAAYHCTTTVRQQQKSLLQLTQETRAGQLEFVYRAALQR